MFEASEPAKLGPVVYKRHPQILPIAVGAALVAGSFVALWLVIAQGNGNLRLDVAVFCPLFCFMGGAMIWFARLRFQLHEQGVSTGKNDLTFDEIESFLFTAKPYRYEGTYGGTWKTMTFHPYPSSRKPKICLRYEIYYAEEPEVERFRQRLLKHICRRMLDQIEQTGKAAWIAGLTFRQDGLEYVSARGLPTVVPYPDLQAAAEDRLFKKKFVLRDAAHDQTIAKIALDTPNLSSGRAVISEMLERQLDSVAEPR